MPHRIALIFLFLLILLTRFAEASIVGVMATDEEELGNIVSFMEAPVKRYIRGMRTFYKGYLWGHETVIVLSNVGKAAAASATVDLIGEGATCIVFLGTAGALDSRLGIGDVVIAKNLIEFDVDFRPFASLYSFPDKKNEYHPDSILGEKTRDVIKEFLGNEMFLQIDEKTRKEMHIEAPKVITAGIATADHFLLSDEEIYNLKTSAPDVVCIDMESASVAQVANNYGLPYIIIRIISDNVESPCTSRNSSRDCRVAMDYNAFLQKVEAVYTKNILQRLLAKVFITDRAPIDLKIPKEPLTTGILCSTEEELQSLLRLLKNPQIINRGGHDFYRGEVGKNRVVIATSGFGKAASSAVAEELIFNEKVKLLLAVGKAFSANENVHVHDIVISNSTLEYDVDVRPFRPLFQLPTIGVTDLPAHAKTVQMAYDMSTKQGVHIGQVASGDKVLSQKELLLLKQSLPHVLCTDFEAAPAAQIAYQSHIPFLSIKEISEGGEFNGKLDVNLLHILQNLFNRLEEKDLE